MVYKILGPGKVSWLNYVVLPIFLEFGTHFKALEVAITRVKSFKQYGASFGKDGYFLSLALLWLRNVLTQQMKPERLSRPSRTPPRATAWTWSPSEPPSSRPSSWCHTSSSSKSSKVILIFMIMLCNHQYKSLQLTTGWLKFNLLKTCHFEAYATMPCWKHQIPFEHWSWAR